MAQTSLLVALALSLGVATVALAADDAKSQCGALAPELARSGATIEAQLLPSALQCSFIDGQGKVRTFLVDCAPGRTADDVVRAGKGKPPVQLGRAGYRDATGVWFFDGQADCKVWVAGPDDLALARSLETALTEANAPKAPRSVMVAVSADACDRIVPESVRARLGGAIRTEQANRGKGRLHCEYKGKARLTVELDCLGPSRLKFLENRRKAAVAKGKFERDLAVGQAGFAYRPFKVQFHDVDSGCVVEAGLVGNDAVLGAIDRDALAADIEAALTAKTAPH